MSHKWQASGGCDSNPGVWDNGNGGIEYVSVCSHCGLTRTRGSDYTGQRPGNTFGPIYHTPLGVRVGAISCSAATVQHIDEAERRRQAAEAEKRAAETRLRAAEAEARNNRQRRNDNFLAAGAAVTAAYPQLRGLTLDVIGNEDWSFCRFTPSSPDLPVVDYDNGRVSIPRLVRNQRWLTQ